MAPHGLRWARPAAVWSVLKRQTERPDDDVERLRQELALAHARCAELESQLHGLREMPNYPSASVAQLDLLGDHHAFFRKLCENTVCGVYVFDLDSGQNIYVNPQYTATLGYTLDELNAMDPQRFAALFHPDDFRRVLDHMAAVGRSADDGVVPIEYRFRHKNGAWVWCRSYDVCFARRPDGRMSQFLGSFVEITDIMEAKESEAHFAQMAAHDLRAPTRRMCQHVELLREELHGAAPSGALRALDQIERQARSMQNLVEGLRRLTGLTVPAARSVLPLAPLVDQAIQTIHGEFSGVIGPVECASLPIASVYPSLLQTLFTNLLTNAVEHGAPGAPIRVTAEHVGDELVLGVCSVGPPIPPGMADTIFMPFRRATTQHNGAGLGLAICKRVVECHRGRMWLACEAGTVHFRFTLGGATD